MSQSQKLSLAIISLSEIVRQSHQSIKSWYKGAHAFPGYGGEGYTDDADVDRFNMDDLDEPDFDRICSVLSLGLNFAGCLIESGVSTTFQDFADRMLSMLGERIQPYLKSLYEGIRWMPGFEKYNFSPTQEVDDFEIDSSEFDPEAFMAMTLPERFHAYMVREMCSEEDYQVMMSNNGYEYLPMRYRIKKEIPAEFYAYFHDLIHEEENEDFYNKFIQSLHGVI